jgi:hypothetical protein
MNLKKIWNGIGLKATTSRVRAILEVKIVCCMAKIFIADRLALN